MIITLTLNPAIDKTLTLDSFNPAQMNRAVSGTQDPGGKGINVSKVIKALHGESTAMGIIGGSTGQFIESDLMNKGIRTDFVMVNDPTRTNLKIFCKDNQETIEVNEAGPVIDADTLDALNVKILSQVTAGTICVVSGSVPGGVAKTYYQELMTAIKNKGAVVIFDADGDLFKNGILARPDFIKPNKKELEAYFGKTMETMDDFKACGQYFIDLGIKNVIFSLGSEGAFFMNEEGAFRAKPLKVDAHSSVGAGDAFVGALAFALEAKYNVVDTLKLAIATSAGAVTTIGTNPADLAWIDAHKTQVAVERL